MKITPAGVALFLALALAGCSGGSGHDPDKAKGSVDLMRAFARDKIQDPARSEKLAGLIDSYEKQVGALNARLQVFRSESQALNADYDAPRERFQKLADDFTVDRKPLQAAVLDTVLAMKAATTPEEWKSLAELEVKAMKANFQSERPANNQ